MMTFLVERSLRAAEAEIGEPVDFLRQIYRASPAALFKFALFRPLADHRAAAPPELCYLVRLVVTRLEDCGPCLRIAVRQARKAGVDPALIRATLAGEPERLPEAAAEAYRFAEAVVSKDEAVGELSAALGARHGEAALVDLALGIATARVFTTVKRALGHGGSCAAVTLDV